MRGSNPAWKLIRNTAGHHSVLDSPAAQNLWLVTSCKCILGWGTEMWDTGKECFWPSVQSPFWFGKDHHKTAPLRTPLYPCPIANLLFFKHWSLLVGGKDPTHTCSIVLCLFLLLVSDPSATRSTLLPYPWIPAEWDWKAMWTCSYSPCCSYCCLFFLSRKPGLDVDRWVLSWSSWPTLRALVLSAHLLGPASIPKHYSISSPNRESCCTVLMLRPPVFAFYLRAKPVTSLWHIFPWS